MSERLRSWLDSPDERYWSPGRFGITAASNNTSVCRLCGAVVFDTHAHEAYHRESRRLVCRFHDGWTAALDCDDRHGASDAGLNELIAANVVGELEADNADLRRAIELAEDPEFVLRHRELEKLIEAGEVSIGISADEFRQRYIGKDRPADLASDDRLIPLPGGRIAVAAQDLKAGDVVAFEEVTRIVRHGLLVEAQTDGDTCVYWDGTLVLLDKAAGS